MSIVTNLIRERDVDMSKLSKKDKRKETKKRVLNLFFVLIAFSIQLTTAYMSYNGKESTKYVIGVNLLTTLIAFFYKKEYFRAAHSLTIANCIVSLAMVTYTIGNELSPLIGKILVPIVAVLFIVLDFFTLRFNDLINVIVSVNAFHLVVKYMDGTKWIPELSTMVVYVIMMIGLTAKKPSLAIYISRIMNFFQIFSLSLDAFARIKGISIVNNDTLFYANAAFLLAIIITAFLGIPKVTKAKSPETQTPEEEENINGSTTEALPLEVEPVIETPDMNNDLAKAKGFRGWQESSLVEPVGKNEKFTPSADHYSTPEELEVSESG